LLTFLERNTVWSLPAVVAIVHTVLLSAILLSHESKRIANYKFQTFRI